MDPEINLINKILHGDRQAFKVLVEQHQKLVLHMAGRILDDPQDREDVCQEVFLKVHRHLPSFNHASKLSTWIAAIAYRTAINYRKKNKRARQAIPIKPDTAVDLSAGQQLDRSDIQRYLHQQIETLPIHYKTVLTLFHLEEMNYAEIVAVTGMPEGTVKNYLFRARKLLKDKLEHFFTKEEWR